MNHVQTPSPLNSLRVFEAAARHLSFTRAAEELFVTQAAVSHQIKTLEDYLGLKLFRRRNRSLLLTEEGQSYFLDIKDVFTSLAEATDKVLERSEKGALTISLPQASPFNGSFQGLRTLMRKNPTLMFALKLWIWMKALSLTMWMLPSIMGEVIGRVFERTNCIKNVWFLYVRLSCCSVRNH